MAPIEYLTIHMEGLDSLNSVLGIVLSLITLIGLTLGWMRNRFPVIKKKIIRLVTRRPGLEFEVLPASKRKKKDNRRTR